MIENFNQVKGMSGMFMTYEMFNEPTPTLDEVITEIRCVDKFFALSIIFEISNLSSEDQKKIANNLLEKYVSKKSRRKIYAFDASVLHQTIKMFLKYGVSKIELAVENKCVKRSRVAILALKIASLQGENIVSSNDSLEKEYFKASLVNRNQHFASIVSRQLNIYGNIPKKLKQHNNGYIDIEKVFKEKYGYTINEYIFVLNSINTLIEAFPNNSNTLFGVDENFVLTNPNVPMKRILEDLCVDMNELTNSLTDEELKNFYDIKKLVPKPLFKRNLLYVPFSIPILQMAMFDGLWFKVKIACEEKKLEFPNFYGRLFEEYVSEILNDAIENSKIEYKFIEEFSYGKQNTLSSDCYLRFNDKLLIIEVKARRIREETKNMASSNDIFNDFNNLSIKPIKQAYTAFENIMKEDPKKFENIKEVYIFSVTSSRFPRIVSMQSKLKTELNKMNDSRVKKIDYIGVEDFEAICMIIEEGKKNIFELFDEQNVYIPISNYYYERFGGLKNTRYSLKIIQSFDKTFGVLG